MTKTIKCHGKINLSLNILGRRDDGYHFIDSVMTGVGLYDEVIVSKRRDSKVAIRFEGEGAKAIGYDNTVRRAVELLRCEFGIFSGVDIVVKKGLGIGGGLGGSAADAAGVIRGVNELFGLFEGSERFYGLCERLGSDTRFMAMLIEKGESFCARVRGTGEMVETIENNLGFDVMIEKGAGVSSKDAYELFDRLYPDFVCCPSDNEKLIECLKTGDKTAVDYMGNALDKASVLLSPEIEAKKEKLIRAGAKRVLVAGSGGSVVGVM